MSVKQEGLGTNKLAQQVTVLVTELDDLSSILGTHTVEGENPLPKVVP